MWWQHPRRAFKGNDGEYARRMETGALCAKEMRNLRFMIPKMLRMLLRWAGVLIVGMFASSSTTGAESTGTVGGRKVTLAGVLRLGTTNLVCMVPGLKNHESFS